MPPPTGSRPPAERVDPLSTDDTDPGPVPTPEPASGSERPPLALPDDVWPGASRGRLLLVAGAVGALLGLGVSALTGVVAWAVIGAIAGIGVGDVLAGGRR